MYMYTKFSPLKKYFLPFYLPTSTSALLSRRQALSWLYAFFFCHTCLWLILGLFLGSFDISFILLSMVWFWFWAPVCFFFCVVFLISELFFFFEFITNWSLFFIIGGAPLLFVKCFLLACFLYLLFYGLKIIFRLLFLLLTNSFRMIMYCLFISIYLCWYFFRYDLGFFVLSVVFEIVYEIFIVSYFFFLSVFGKFFKPLIEVIKKGCSFALNLLFKLIFFFNEKNILNLNEKFKMFLIKRLLKYTILTKKEDLDVDFAYRMYSGFPESGLCYNDISTEDLKKTREDARQLRNLYIELKKKKNYM